jgi:hypothetical protein
MKKWIMATAFLVGLSGFAAAQTTSKTGKKTPAKQAVKKGEVVKSGTSKKTPAQDTTVYKLPMPTIVPDSLQVPKGKNEQ